MRIVTEDKSTQGPVQSHATFEERLQAAEQRSQRGAGAGTAFDRPGSAARSEYEGMGLVVRLGSELVSAMVVGVAIGYGLGRWLGHRPLFLVVFSLLGGVAGVLNVWRFANRAGQG